MDYNINLAKFDELVLKGEATWWQMELPSGRVIFGDAKAKMLGFSNEHFEKYQDFTGLIHSDDYEKAMRSMKDHLDNKIPAYETLYKIRTINDDYINFFDYGQKVKNENGKITIIGFVIKIKNFENYLEEIKNFKELITGGQISVIDLFNKIR